MLTATMFSNTRYGNQRKNHRRSVSSRQISQSIEFISSKYNNQNIAFSLNQCFIYAVLPHVLVSCPKMTSMAKSTDEYAIQKYGRSEFFTLRSPEEQHEPGEEHRSIIGGWSAPLKPDIISKRFTCLMVALIRIKNCGVVKECTNRREILRLSWLQSEKNCLVCLHGNKAPDGLYGGCI